MIKFKLVKPKKGETDWQKHYIAYLRNFTANPKDTLIYHTAFREKGYKTDDAPDVLAKIIEQLDTPENRYWFEKTYSWGKCFGVDIKEGTYNDKEDLAYFTELIAERLVRNRRITVA